MLLIRETFYCKPGKVRPMVDKFKTMGKVMERLNMGKPRIYTDLSTDRYWTLVVEFEVNSMGDFEKAMSDPATAKEFEVVMKDYHEYVDSGRREIYRVEA